MWVVHRAFETSNRVTRQVAVMPDGRTYLWIARMVQGPVVGFDSPRREHAVVLGCDIAFAQRMIYADGHLPRIGNKNRPRLRYLPTNILSAASVSGAT